MNIELSEEQKMFKEAAFTEQSGGTDLAALQTTARVEGEFYVLNGQKAFISHANHAVRLTGSPSTRGTASSIGLLRYCW
ncbi:MAG: acyl-CoA dehydrogenase family protein [Chloroflexi bacterium]|nr:acyl-CoA dehydrogenase family protein [Chloroflexota bacterium]